MSDIEIVGDSDYDEDEDILVDDVDTNIRMFFFQSMYV